MSTVLVEEEKKLTKLETLKAYMDGWKAGASGSAFQVEYLNTHSTFRDGYYDGIRERISKTNLMVSNLDITTEELADAVLR